MGEVLANVAAAADGGASANTLGQAFNIFHTGNVSSILKLLVGCSVIIGLVLTWKGLTKLKEAADTNGTQVRYSEGFYRLAAGTFLISLVSTLLTGWASLGVGDTPLWHSRAVAPGGTETVEAGDFVLMMSNFAIDAAGPLSTLVLAVSVIIGIALIISSIVSFSKIDANGGREGFGSVAMRFFVGVLLTNTYWAITIVSQSFGFESPFDWVGGSDFSAMGEKAKESLLSYTREERNVPLLEHARYVIKIAFMALVPFGLISFVRGLLIMKDSVEANKQASLGAAFVYLLAGIALVNSEKFSCVVTTTFIGTPASWCGGG